RRGSRWWPRHQRALCAPGRWCHRAAAEGAGRRRCRRDPGGRPPVARCPHSPGVARTSVTSRPADPTRPAERYFAMTFNVVPMTEAETSTLERTEADDGLGALQTERGNLPLESIDVSATITGLVARTRLTQGFRNPYDVPLEATYVFPLPDRAAVVAMRMTAADRTIEAELKERAKAREEYERAIAEGKRASIAEEERPDVFTMRVGNILPGEQVRVELTMVGPLSYEDGEGTYRLPLVVAP